ncbi:MAG: hypothetical protein Q9174_005313, partial [Haloplaca sp. 1 TL-2023]
MPQNPKKSSKLGPKLKKSFERLRPKKASEFDKKSISKPKEQTAHASSFPTTEGPFESSYKGPSNLQQSKEAQEAFEREETIRIAKQMEQLKVDEHRGFSTYTFAEGFQSPEQAATPTPPQPNDGSQSLSAKWEAEKKAKIRGRLNN